MCIHVSVISTLSTVVCELVTLTCTCSIISNISS